MMGDACLCIDVDMEPGSYILKQKVVTARKEHICTECNEKIKKGKKYELVNYVLDGDIETYKTCIPCKNVRDSLFQCGFYFGMLWEDLENHFRDMFMHDDDFEDDDFKWLKG